MSSDNDEGYDSGQEASLAVPIKDFNSNYLATPSIQKGGDGLADSQETKSIFNVGMSNDINKDFQSETQFQLNNEFQFAFERAQNPQREKGPTEPDSNDEEEENLGGVLNILDRHDAPDDASGCTKIQSLKEYINGIQSEQKNPKKNFFDLSTEYYTGKYKGDNKREIKVRSYLITEKHENFIKDLSMEIIQTNQGCMPIIKTFEFNAYNDKKFVKALKFYNYKGDCKLKNQIIVDEGVMCDKFRTYDTSLLHFGNSILFYRREENWHKLQKYDVVTDTLEEIVGYNLEEPIGEEIRYHVMFSCEFGQDRKAMLKKGKAAEKKNVGNPDAELHAFIEKHYVWVQSYQITEELQYINKPLKGFFLRRAAKKEHLPEMTPLGGFSDKVVGQPQTFLTKDKQQWVKKIYQNREGYEYQVHIKDNEHGIRCEYEVHQYPIQYISHKINYETGEITFVAFDSFNSHHFSLSQGSTKFGNYTSFYGNNENHMQPHIKEKILEPVLRLENENDDDYLERVAEVEQEKHKEYMPFLKHQNAQFTVQKEKIQIKRSETEFEDIDQFFYMTNDNQYMLIYPNYEQGDKKKVIFQLAQRFQYNQNPDVDYDYQDDYEVRMRDFFEVNIKKVSHICINAYRSKNYMKRARHIQEIVKQVRPFSHQDKVILSTDQQSNLIYIYQSFVVQESVGVEVENKIEIYNYENNIVNTKPATTLPKLILEAEDIQRQLYGNHNLPQTYYINSKWRNVVSNSQFIKTDVKNKNKRINLDNQMPHKREEIILALKNDPNCREQYHDLNHFLKADQMENFILVEDYKTGKYMSIRVKQDTTHCNLYLQMYTHNQRNYTFFFHLVNEKDKNEPKSAYFALKKNEQEINDLCQNNKDALFENFEANKVTVFMNNTFESEKEGQNLDNYTKQMTMKELIEDMKNPQTWKIKLVFERVMDNRANIDFLPIIYQERGNDKSHHLLSFNIHKMKVCRHSRLQGRMRIRKLLRKNEEGFGHYTVTRTSEQYSMPQPLFFIHQGGCQMQNQLCKYQVTTQYMVSDDSQNPASCTIDLSEYAIHGSCCVQNRIQLIGMKQMLVSEASQVLRKETFDKVFFLPWVNKHQKFNGSQFVLQEEEDKTVIRLLDQNINSLFQHTSDTIQYGHQKFLTSQDSHDEYILVISSQLRRRVYMSHFFDNSESYWIHTKVIKKLLSMQLAKFEYFVLNDDFEQLMREEFYQGQEVLQGKSINDLCLGFPREVAHGLKQSYDQYSNIRGSLIEEVSNGEEVIMHNYENLGVCEKNLLVQVDFNFCSSLRIAAELNSNQSVKMLMAKIFDMNDIKYQEIFMLELPRMLQLPRIERFFDFLTRDYEEKQAILEKNAESLLNDNKMVHDKFLNFEDYLHHPKLPQFLEKNENYHIKYRFDDFHNEDQEIVEELVQNDQYSSVPSQSLMELMKNLIPAKYRKVPDAIDYVEEKNVDVEHSIINFSRVIIGEKIRNIQENNYRHTEFNDNHLASIFWVEDEDYIEFYNLEAVRKIVDFQFVRTQNFLQIVMMAYVGGFLVPFTLSLSIQNAFFLNILYTICLFFQVFFIVFEVLQVKEQGLSYFTDMWNILDTTQFLNFLILYSIKMSSQFQTDSMLEILLQALLLIQTFYKVLYFLRIYESFSFLITMSMLVVRDLFPFLILAMIIMLAITKQYTIMHFGINDPDGLYAGVSSKFMKLMIQTYRSNKGDVNVPELDGDFLKEYGNQSFYANIMFFLNIVVWLAQQAIFVFLGAQFFSGVYQSYEKWNPFMPMFMYKSKAKFNNECYDILDMFQKQNPFKVICFAIAKSKPASGGWYGTTHAIKLSMNAQLEGQKLYNSKQKKLANQRFEKIKQSKATVDSMEVKLDQLSQWIHNQQNQQCRCERL